MNTQQLDNNNIFSSSNFIDRNTTPNSNNMINTVDRTMRATANSTVNMVDATTMNTEFDRPTKKIRPEPTTMNLTITAGASTAAAANSVVTTLDTVLILTEIGIANYALGDHSKAEQFFSQALRRVDSNCATTTNSQLQPWSYFSQQQKQLLRHETDATTKTVTAADATFGHDHTAANRTPEYDEGMLMYRTPLAVGVNDMSTSQDAVISTLYYNMGQTYIRQGLYDDAALLFTRALEVLSGVVGCFSPTSSSPSSLLAVKTLHCLGYCSYRTGGDARALTFYQRALELISDTPANVATTMDPEHLAVAFNCVGVLHFNKQDNGTELAMEMFQQSLRLYQSCNDASSDMMASVATVLNNIGRVHYLRSDFGDAITAYQQSLDMRREILGQDSIDVAATVYNIGQTYHQLKMWDDALQHYEEFLRIAKIGDEVISLKDLALVYKSIAEIYHEQSKLPHAREYFVKALDAQSAENEMSNDIATTLNKLGNLCYEMRDFKAAMHYYQQGLDVERKVLPANHPHTIITQTNIAHIHKQLGQHREALIAYQAVGKMQIPVFGGESLNVAETLSSVGLMQYHLRDYESSFESYQEALRIRRESYGTDEHPDIASTLNSIGLVLFKQDLFDLAKQCFIESLRIRTKLIGKDHRDVAILWYNIATIYFETGEDERAIEMYKETLRVERKALGNNHSDVVLTLQHLGQVHQQLGQFEEALQYFQEALDIERKRPQSEKKSSPVGRILNLIGNVYLQLGKTEEMMECYIEASRLYEANTNVQETLVIAGYNHYGLSKTNPPCAPVA